MDRCCPCGSQRAEDACCGPLLRGEREAADAEELARARYSAYTRHQIDFLLRTYCPDRQYLFDRETTLLWARRSQWTAFEIRGSQPLDPATAASDGGDEDREAAAPPEAAQEVEFIARYHCGGRAFLHHEIARFHRLQGRWYYIDGRFPNQEALLGTESKRLRCEQDGASR